MDDRGRLRPTAAEEESQRPKIPIRMTVKHRAANPATESEKRRFSETQEPDVPLTAAMETQSGDLILRSANARARSPSVADPLANRNRSSAADDVTTDNNVDAPHAAAAAETVASAAGAPVSASSARRPPARRRPPVSIWFDEVSVPLGSTKRKQRPWCQIAKANGQKDGRDLLRPTELLEARTLSRHVLLLHTCTALVGCAFLCYCLM